MQVPITRERETLDKLLHDKNWKGLESFGITNANRESSTLDCVQYVFYILGVPANPEMMTALQELEKSNNAPAEGIVFYQRWTPNGLTTMHYGIVEGDHPIIRKEKLVRSKWGSESPVLRHPLKLVPAAYGQSAVFCTMKAAREHVYDKRNLTMFGPDNY